MAQFTKEVCRLLGIDQNISFTFHPQTDGQFEQTNQWVEQYLQIYGNFQQNNWVDWLPMAQFVYNSWLSHTTGFTPFQLLMGFTPKLEATSQKDSPFPSIKQWKINLEQRHDCVQEAIQKAQRMMILQGERK